MTVLEKIQETGLLRVGIREDAVPFGYRNSENNLSGLCLDYINLLRQEIQNNLQKEVITIQLFQSTVYNRFGLVQDRVIDLECGPNTIRPELEQKVNFSTPFLVTGVQFLIRKEDQSKFNFRGSLENFTIGVLRGTSTEEFIKDRYPLATIQQFQGATGRRRGIQALQRKAIDAFVSDGILLLGEATVLGLSLEEDYLLVPQRPLTCEYYGFILPNNDEQWQNFINETIEIARTKLIIADWFGVVDTYLQESAANCKAVFPQ